jgi:aspartyl-tRNA(Asn)/glutamyl-tRNA(Gln) amidotransferase subunit A
MLTEACLGQVERHDSDFSAFVTITRDSARAAALAAEREIQVGRWRGPLHGMPIGIKDVIDVAGVPTTAQSRQLEGYVPDRNAAVVERLADAGAVLMGKLTTHEFAFGTPKWGPPGPPARNPWDLRRFAGGSSSGAAVATATGMVLGAIGTDTAGSIRSPAALCGVAGLKPSRSRIPAQGVFPLSSSLDAVGPLAWTVEDCATIFASVARPLASDPKWLSDEGFPILDTDMRGLRVGVLRHFFSRDATLSDDAAAAMAGALDIFRKLGCRVQDVSTAPLEEWNAVGMIILLAEAFAFHEPWLRDRSHLYGEHLRDALLLGATVDAADYVEALGHRVRLAAALQETFKDHDVLVSPIQPGEAGLIESISKWGFVERPSFGIPFNVGDSPALTVCCGFGRQGLPLALQLVARRDDEPTLLRAGHAYELIAGWRERRPVS